MSDSLQGSSVSPSDAPIPEAIPAEVDTAPTGNFDSVPVTDEIPAVPPSPSSDSQSSAEIPVPEHSNISSTDADTNSIGLENVGMSVEADLSASPASAPDTAENPSPSVAQPIQPPASVAAPVGSLLLSLRTKALEAIQFRRRARLEKIIALAEKKKSIGNDDVEKLLHVSDSTATRYLAALVRDGKLKQIGVPQAQRYSMPSGSNGAV